MNAPKQEFKAGKFGTLYFLPLTHKVTKTERDRLLAIVNVFCSRFALASTGSSISNDLFYSFIAPKWDVSVMSASFLKSVV